MLTKKKYRLLLLLSVLVFSIFGLNWCYQKYQDGAFKRAYEGGNTYTQLNSLMNTTRYVDDVRKAGYEVEQWGVIWNSRIDSLKTHTSPSVIISVPQEDRVRTRITINENEQITLRYDIRMKLKEVVYFKGDEILTGKEIPQDIYDKYVKLSNEGIASLLKDVYTEMYGKK